MGRAMRGATAVLLLALLSAAAPQGFADQPQPPPPDYTLASNWAAWPGAPGAAATVPPGATPAARAPRVDVFYVGPTTYRSAERWNQDVADAAANAFSDASAVARQASVFNACCRVFAPRYRQASSRAFATMAGEGAKAYDLAYADVVRAFDAFLIASAGRPFVLAGHSQGSFHLARLIGARLDGTPLARRMVAAYLPGYTLSEGDFGRTFRSVTACATPAQTGCIALWNAVLPSAERSNPAGEKRYIARYGDAPGRTLSCVDPLTFDRARPAAGRDAARGAIPGPPDASPVQRLRARAVAARCDNGLLVVEPDPALGLTPLPGGSLHFHEYGLFYADIRANAVRRSAAWFRASRG